MIAVFIIKFVVGFSFVHYVYGLDRFYVEKSGHTKVKPGEISVIFYMTVANGGKSTVKVYSKNINCCWIHDETTSKYDCESMDVLGGIPVTLDPSKTANVTYIFTNLYPLDRVGQCVFHLWHSDHKIAHTIRFNTTYMNEESWAKSIYKKITGEFEEDYSKCETVDLDKRRKCKPVNCVQKYNGKRNFFRKETKLCEPVYECHTTTDDDNLPTTAFDKDHNRCKSLLQKELTKEEERNLKKEADENLGESQKKKFKYIDGLDPIPIRCNHGKHVGSICVCDDGWKTDTSNVPLGDPKFIYNWCNVKTRKKTLLSYKHQKQFMIAGLSLTMITLLVAWLWLVYRYFYQPITTVKAQPPSKAHKSLSVTNELINKLSSDVILKRKSTPPPKGLSFEPAYHDKPIVIPPATKTPNKSTFSLVPGKRAVTFSGKSLEKFAPLFASQASGYSLAGERSQSPTVGKTTSKINEGVYHSISQILEARSSDDSEEDGAFLSGQKSTTQSVSRDRSLFATSDQVSNVSFSGTTRQNMLSGSRTSNHPSARISGDSFGGRAMPEDYSGDTVGGGGSSVTGQTSTMQPGVYNVPQLISASQIGRSPHSVTGAASTVSGQAMGIERSTMSSLAQSSELCSNVSLSSENTGSSVTSSGPSQKSMIVPTQNSSSDSD